MNNYYLDKTIISMLFGVEDEAKLEEMDLFFTDVILRSSEQISRDFLIKNGMPENEVEAFFKDEGENPKIKELLNSQDLLNQLVENRNIFYKKIYDTYEPKLTDEKRKVLNDYLELVKVRNTQQASDLEMMIKFTQTRDQLLSEQKITQQDLDSAIEEALDKVIPTTDTTQTPVENPQ